MDKAYWDTMYWDNFRWDVFDPVHDEIMDQLKKQPACHLGNCAPAVWGSSRWAGTLPDGSTLHCRWHVKIPRHDETMEALKK